MRIPGGGFDTTGKRGAIRKIHLRPRPDGGGAATGVRARRARLRLLTPPLNTKKIAGIMPSFPNSLTRFAGSERNTVNWESAHSFDSVRLNLSGTTAPETKLSNTRGPYSQFHRDTKTCKTRVAGSRARWPGISGCAKETGEEVGICETNAASPFLEVSHCVAWRQSNAHSNRRGPELRADYGEWSMKSLDGGIHSSRRWKILPANYHPSPRICGHRPSKPGQNRRHWIIRPDA